MSQVYEDKYATFSNHLGFLVKAMNEESASTVLSAARNSGEEGVQALFDVLMDQGHRGVLVQALNSPAITGWVREKLEVFLYGEKKQHAALFKPTTIH
jgi:hypothetical protein